jgi:hypothetical protein
VFILCSVVRTKEGNAKSSKDQMMFSVGGIQSKGGKHVHQIWETFVAVVLASSLDTCSLPHQQR